MRARVCRASLCSLMLLSYRVYQFIAFLDEGCADPEEARVDEVGGRRKSGPRVDRAAR